MLRDILDFTRDRLSDEGIEYVSALPLSECKIIKPYLLSRENISSGSVIMLAVPYYFQYDERNISLYACGPDYHEYFSQLFARILPVLRENFKGIRFAAFADHSPIDEVGAAAKCGLGVIGENHLLITEKYSSFVFLGEIICDCAYEGELGELSECEKCGKCRSACPCGLDISRCLSALTQKKGEFSEEERERLISGGSAWGCDICQLACPHSHMAERTTVDFFLEGHISYIDFDIINNMSEDEFAERAYSWRGKETLLRNLELLKKREKDDR